MEPAILRVCGIRKWFPGPVKAVECDPSDEIVILPGEVRGLVGENGAGKSTLVCVVAGVYASDAGDMWLRGEPYLPSSLVDAQAKGVGFVFQEPTLLPTLTVADNILLGEEDSFSRGGILSLRARNRMGQEVLNRLGFGQMRADTVVNLLDFESRRLVELAKAMHRNPILLIIDEATAGLSLRGSEILFNAIRQLKETGAAVIYITHYLEEVFQYCDTVTVMKDGRLVKTLPVAETDADELATLMVGRELKASYLRSDWQSSAGDRLVLRVENLGVQGAFEDISFDVHEGEILGIGGLVGGGVQELCRALFGDLRLDRGRIWYMGEPFHPTPQKAVRQGVAYVPKERDKEGVILRASIRDNISLPILDRFVKRGLLDLPKEDAAVRDYMQELHIVARGPQTLCIQLSGGNRQRVVLTKWLATDSKLYILSNPARGCDVATKADIYRFMMRLKEEGSAIVLFSEELAELIGMSDRVLVMREGVISKQFIRDEHPTEEQLIQHMI